MFLNRFKKYDFPLLGYIKMPKIVIDEKQRNQLNLSQNATPDDYLKALVHNGLKEKISSGKIAVADYQEYKDRADHELKIICDLGFASYILLVYEILRYCRENNILNSPSRGSVGGSLCCYLTQITKIDPIKHGLLFSRFLSSDRAEKKEINGEIYIKSDSLPDIDLDSEHRGKPLVKAKIEAMYPKRTVAISNVSTLSSKVLIKEVLKIYWEYSETQAKEVSDMIDKTFGKVSTIKKSLENNKIFQKWAADKKEIIDICCKLQDMTRHKSVHAAGVLLCERPIEEMIPVELDKDGNQVCAYDMDSAQMLGIKVDNLAVITLDICHDCLTLIGKPIDFIDQIDVEDQSIYDYLCSNEHYYGLFQVSEGVGKQTLIKIQPKNIDNIIDSIAIGRPGSLAFIDTYVKKSADLSKIDPRVRDLLEETRGIIIYQETVMKLAIKMADFTPQEADKLRKGIGKKKKEIILSMKEKFINGAVKNKYDAEFITWCWSTFEASADYSFNKSHSTGYAYLTALSTYLKANHTKEYFLSCLKHIKENSKKNTVEAIALIQSELAFFGIELLPPHILDSELDFTIEGNNIRFGLGQIKGIAEKSIEKLDKFRTKFLNKLQVFEAAQEAGIPISILNSLILVGALENKFSSRSRVVLEAQLWNVLSEKEKRYVFDKDLGKQFEYDVIRIVKHVHANGRNEKDKPIIRDSRMETIRTKFAPYKAMYEFNRKNEKLARYFFEYLLLGYSYSTTLKDIYSKYASDLINISEVKNCFENEYVHFAGRALEVKEGTSKNEKKTKYLACDVQDETGVTTVMLFNDKIIEHKEQNERAVEKDDIIVVRGKWMGDKVFADKIGIQDVEVFFRTAEVTKHLKDQKKSVVAEALKAENAGTI